VLFSAFCFSILWTLKWSVDSNFFTSV
jgi:hypothetical protein